MSTTVRAVQVPGQIATIEFFPNTDRIGAQQLDADRSGDQWATAHLRLAGPNYSTRGMVSLTSGALRDLARYALRHADFIDARISGRPAPCMCALWASGHDPVDLWAFCPNDAADDYTMCRTCWVLEGGQQGHDARHGTTSYLGDLAAADTGR